MLELSLGVERTLPLAPVVALSGGGRLTPREREVLDLILAGDSNRRIAERLYISPETVKTHVRHILAKTGAARKAELRALLPARIP